MTESGKPSLCAAAKPTSPAVTREQALAAVRTLLRWAGDEPSREGLRDTPKRVVDAYAEWFSGYNEDPQDYLSRTFEEVAGYDEMVVLRDIAVRIYCEHHMAPIIGRAHVGYLPDGKVVGISKLARVVDAFARRFQVQEKMTAQIAACIKEVLQPRGVGVVIEAVAPVHDHARRAQARRVDDHQPDARHFPRRRAHARGVSALHRHRQRALRGHFVEIAANDPSPVRRAALTFIFVTVMLDMLAFGIIIPVLPHLIVRTDRRQHRQGRGVVGRVRRAVHADAVHLLAGAGHAVGPFRPAHGDPDLQLRSRHRLHRDGAGTGAVAAVHRPRRVGRLRGKLLHRERLYRRHRAEGETRRRVRHAGRRVRHRLHRRSGAGRLLGHLHIRLPFWVAAGLSLLNFCYGYFVLPESLPKERRSARFDWRHANPFGALVLLRRYPQVFALAAVFFLIELAQFSLNSTYVLYTDYRYGWGPQAVGYTLGLVGLCSGDGAGGTGAPADAEAGRAADDHGRSGLCMVGYLCVRLRLRTHGCSCSAFRS